MTANSEYLRLQIHELEGKVENMQQIFAIEQEAQAILTKFETEKEPARGLDLEDIIWLQNKCMSCDWSTA